MPLFEFWRQVNLETYTTCLQKKPYRETLSPMPLFGFWRQVNLETFTTCLQKKATQGDLVSIATFLILETS